MEEKVAFFGEQLKATCGANGKEQHPSESAAILNQLGMVFKDRSPDRISLIQSAVLLNAAIVRQPDNVCFKRDLNRLCSQVLRCANAKAAQADLVKIAVEISMKVKSMRKETNDSLEQLQPIPYGLTDQELQILENNTIDNVQSIQNHVADAYTKIMQSISIKCIDTMGNPPCRYTVVGMGSLARKEITPYSDFEHCIVLEEGVQLKDNKEEILEYFRWYSVIFHIIVINLQETTVRSVSIPSLNDYSVPGGDWFFDAHTTNGISFDGMVPHACKFPLGRTQMTEEKPWTTELIRPISAMVHLLDSDVDLKNGYYLADILTRTCFVSGDEAIYNDFQIQVRQMLNMNKESCDVRIQEELMQNLKDFDSFNKLAQLSFSGRVDIKRVVYRSISLFLMAIGRSHSIDKGSCFDIIRSLQEEEVINKETAHRLSYAISIACQVRLHVYMSKRGQEDFVSDRGNYEAGNRKLIIKFFNFVGQRSLVEYFITALCLQKLITQEGVFGELDEMHKRNKFATIQTLFLFDLNQKVLNEWEKYQEKNSQQTLFEDDLYIKYHVALVYYRLLIPDKALSLLEWLDQQKTDDPDFTMHLDRDRGWCLHHMQRYEDAISFNEKAMERIVNSEGIHVYKSSRVLMDLAFVIALSEMQLKRYCRALSGFRDFLKYFTATGNHQYDHQSTLVICYLYMGPCLCDLGHVEQALNKARQALAICIKEELAIHTLCDCYHVLGSCYSHAGKYERALDDYETELRIRLQFVPRVDHDTDDMIQMAKKCIQITKRNLTRDRAGQLRKGWKPKVNFSSQLKVPKQII